MAVGSWQLAVVSCESSGLPANGGSCGTNLTDSGTYRLENSLILDPHLKAELS